MAEVRYELRVILLENDVVQIKVENTKNIRPLEVLGLLERLKMEILISTFQEEQADVSKLYSTEGPKRSEAGENKV